MKNKQRDHVFISDLPNEIISPKVPIRSNEVNTERPASSVYPTEKDNSPSHPLADVVFPPVSSSQDELRSAFQVIESMIDGREMDTMTEKMEESRLSRVLETPIELTV